MKRKTGTGNLAFYTATVYQRYFSLVAFSIHLTKKMLKEHYKK
jgi:hypothetical protein